MDSLKVKAEFYSYMFDNRGLVKLGRFYGEDLAIYSRWIILAEKLAASGIKELNSTILFFCDIPTHISLYVVHMFGLTP